MAPPDLDDGADASFWHHYPECRPCEHPDHVAEPVVVLHDDFYTAHQWLSHPMHLEVPRTCSTRCCWPSPTGRDAASACCSPGGVAAVRRPREVCAHAAEPHLEPLLLAARTAPPVPRLPVTDRQWQILERVRLGLANKQIARDLEVSPATVRKHLENIYRSLDVQSRGAAVHVAFGDADGRLHDVAS